MNDVTEFIRQFLTGDYGTSITTVDKISYYFNDIAQPVNIATNIVAKSSLKNERQSHLRVLWQIQRSILSPSSYLITVVY